MSKEWKMYKGKIEVSVEAETEKEANEWYRFENEDWRLLTEEEIKLLKIE